MNTALLDNVFWHALTGAQAALSAGTTRVRRYARGFSPIVAFAQPQAPDFDALRPYCDVGEAFYVADWSGPVPMGWQLHAEATMHRMVWDAGLPAEEPIEALPLGPEHAAQALQLATLTKPGPFALRTIELGRYWGVFESEGEGARLMAMAGERAHAGTLREISGVCTHPDFQGRGLARRLMLKLLREELQRGETPFLHVMRSNAAAHGLYLRMGFRDHAEPVVRVLANQ